MDTIIKRLQQIIKKNTPEQFTFNLHELPDHNNYELDIRCVKPFSDIFNSLNTKKKDCLYWFSLPEKRDGDYLKIYIENYRDLLELQEDKRVIPVKNDNINSNILYVGVRQGGIRQYTLINKKRVPDELSHIAGRIIQHLGYYKKGTTQGLQLVHWAKELNIQVNLNVIEFQDLPKDYLYIIEKLYSIKLRPILGKH